MSPYVLCNAWFLQQSLTHPPPRLRRPHFGVFVCLLSTPLLSPVGDGFPVFGRGLLVLECAWLGVALVFQKGLWKLVRALSRPFPVPPPFRLCGGAETRTRTWTRGVDWGSGGGWLFDGEGLWVDGRLMVELGAGEGMMMGLMDAVVYTVPRLIAPSMIALWMFCSICLVGFDARIVFIRCFHHWIIWASRCWDVATGVDLDRYASPSPTLAQINGFGRRDRALPNPGLEVLLFCPLLAQSRRLREPFQGWGGALSLSLCSGSDGGLQCI